MRNKDVLSLKIREGIHKAVREIISQMILQKQKSMDLNTKNLDLLKSSNNKLSKVIEKSFGQIENDIINQNGGNEEDISSRDESTEIDSQNENSADGEKLPLQGDIDNLSTGGSEPKESENDLNTTEPEKMFFNMPESSINEAESGTKDLDNGADNKIEDHKNEFHLKDEKTVDSHLDDGKTVDSHLEDEKTVDSHLDGKTEDTQFEDDETEDTQFEDGEIEDSHSADCESEYSNIDEKTDVKDTSVDSHETIPSLEKGEEQKTGNVPENLDKTKAAENSVLNKGDILNYVNDSDSDSDSEPLLESDEEKKYGTTVDGESIVMNSEECQNFLKSLSLKSKNKYQ
jgi:hypothetical protein